MTSRYTMPSTRDASLLLHTNEDHAERIERRRFLERAGVRRRVLCKRCRTPIPDGKRVDALYCSIGCQHKYRWELRNALRSEIRAQYRTMTAAKVCGCCGVDIDNRPGKHGKTALTCQRCRWARNQRLKRRRNRERKAAFCGPLPLRRRPSRSLRPDIHTHCLRGHEYAAAGYYTRKKGGGKICKQCLRDYDAARRPRKKRIV